MTLNNTVKLLETLSSKICHDLISPIGAVSNGVEILEEMGSDAGDDVTELISFSASQASAKLKVLRMAYGVGGSDPSIKLADVHKIFGEYISGENRVSQDWNPHDDLGIEPCDGLCKMVLCVMKLGIEGLPRGGVISVEKADDNAMLICARGENAHFNPEIISSLRHDITIDNICPKLIHSYVTGLIAQHYGFEIHTDETQENIISLRLKRSLVS